ncbi:hypothetical protein [Novosphingobium mangrovi (ex Hu et al. 2023)]|uniref:Uncharacterized protein n=1 Tax=Novosphingobium mangrovi (ex Hu et al. 2023) TaxID=2930094 RepID=A0ABT0AG61_9SPHN|nr:hypothetical protein [Novosphingobium mangrovi (ex Hu et al. 2023)]MCJ1962184.1 hypothetical protein [Novosphingobium mangrovi (ex Hu et al. 2023)]
MKYILTAIFTFLLIHFNKAESFQDAGFLATTSAYIVGFIVGLMGLIIGEKIRNTIKPDFVIADSVSSLAASHIFWSFGMQTIGCFLGIILGAATMFSLLGPTKVERTQDKDAQAFIDGQPLVSKIMMDNPKAVQQIRRTVEKENGANATGNYHLTNEERDLCTTHRLIKEIKMENLSNADHELIHNYKAALTRKMESKMIRTDGNYACFKRDKECKSKSCGAKTLY